MFNNNKDFDFDLARGVHSEKSIGKILGLDKDKFEVKSEFGFWQKSGNLCIELAFKGNPSGLRSTKAKWWIHRFMLNKEVCIGQWITEVKVLKQIVRKFIKENKIEIQGSLLHIFNLKINNNFKIIIFIIKFH